MTGAQFKVTENWLLLGSVRYDLYAHEFDGTRVGVGYIDDCLMLSVNWFTGYTYTGSSTPVLDTSFFIQLSLRTFGGDTLSPISSTP